MGKGNLVDGIEIKLEICLYYFSSPQTKRQFFMLQPTNFLGSMVFGDQSWTSKVVPLVCPVFQERYFLLTS